MSYFDPVTQHRRVSQAMRYTRVLSYMVHCRASYPKKVFVLISVLESSVFYKKMYTFGTDKIY